MYSFDELEGITSGASNSKPIWKIDINNDRELLSWLNNEVSYLLDDSQERIDEIRYHFDLYKGYVWDRSKKAAEYYETEPNKKSRYQKKINVNQLYDLTEQLVARTARYKPAVQVLPQSNEWRDRESARVAKAWIDYMTYKERLDQVILSVVRIAKIAGECYLAIEWDEDKGDIHEAARVLGENRAIGDVSFRLVYPDNIFYEKQDQFCKSNYVFEREYRLTDELKALYPHVGNIGSDARCEIYDRRTGVISNVRNHNTVWTFTHRRTKFLPNGLRIKFIQNNILEKGPLNYRHGELCYERLYDIEIPGEQYAKSFYVHTRNLAGNYSNLTTMIIKNHKLVASPKWMVPLGSINVSDLTNDIGIVTYKGAQPPQLVQSNPTPHEVFTFRQNLKEDLQLIAGVFGQSRGDPPTGITASVALQFLEEQENSRMNAWISQYNDFIRRIFSKAISVAAQYYDESDNRTLKLLGRGNEYVVKKLDVSLLNNNFDIKIQNSTALPDSKAARIQSLMDIKKSFPAILSDEYVADLLDIGGVDSFYSKGLSALRAAELENEEIIYEGRLIDPQEYEDHLKHWNAHVLRIQASDFKNTVPVDKQNLMFNHIRAHEFLMHEKAQKSISYMKTLEGLPQWPIFYEPVSKERSIPMAEEPVISGGQGDLGASEGVSMGPEGELGAEADLLAAQASGAVGGEASSMPMPPTEPPQIIEPTGEMNT